jgi:hypothetical protein
MTDPAYERATRFDDPAMPPGHRDGLRVRWGSRVSAVWSDMVRAPQGEDDEDDGNLTRED